MIDTIVALSSGAPPAAIGVIRLSGPDAFAAASVIAGNLPPPREARVRALRSDGRLLDRALVMRFLASESVTGEDLVEFHVHGGRAVIRSVETALLSLENVRPAEAGEFTRRALSNGRIDLIEAEALGDLLQAETEVQHRAAVQQSSGALRREIDRIQAALLRAAAKMELTLDFSDDEDASGEIELMQDAREILVELVDRIVNWTSLPTTDRLRDGYRVVLAGPPNAGKSSLINRLVNRDVSIVSNVAGTTRDLIEVPVAREGIPFLLIDTAGLAERTNDPIEQVGITRARNAIADADVILWLGSTESPYPDAVSLHAKCDRNEDRPDEATRLAVSAHDGTGIDQLWSLILQAAKSRMPRLDGTALNQRQHSLLLKCRASLKAAVDESDPLLIAHNIAASRTTLGLITGTGGTEDMLDTLFANFCIGK